MKKILALLTALLLCFGLVFSASGEAALQLDSGDWYEITALNLTDRLSLLADNQAYVELFIGLEIDTDTFLAQMNALAGLEPTEIVTVNLRQDALSKLAASYQMEDFENQFTDEIMAELTRRMNMSLPSLLNGYVGGELWLAISSVLTTSESYLMPDDFAPCALYLDYGEGQEAAVLVTFTQSGEGIVTASASFVRAGVLEDEVAQNYLNLMWEIAE